MIMQPIDPFGAAPQSADTTKGKATMKFNFNKFLLAAGFIGATMLSGQAHALASWVSAGKVGDAAINPGVNVSIATLVSGTNTETAALPVNCDAAGKITEKTTSTSDTVAFLLGPTTAISVSAQSTAISTTTTTSLTLVPSAQCYVWAKLTPATGSTGTTTVYVQQENTSRRARPGGA